MIQPLYHSKSYNSDSHEILADNGACRKLLTGGLFPHSVVLLGRDSHRIRLPPVHTTHRLSVGARSSHVSVIAFRNKANYSTNLFVPSRKIFTAGRSLVPAAFVLVLLAKWIPVLRRCASFARKTYTAGIDRFRRRWYRAAAR